MITLRDKLATTVINAIYEKLILEFGTDIEIMADQGSEFMNYYADVLFKTHGVRTHPVKLRTPQQAGMVERFNRTFTDHFTKACESHEILPDQWSQWVLQLCSIYNASYHPAISHTPYFVLHKRDFVPPSFMWTAVSGLTPDGKDPNPIKGHIQTPEAVTARLIQNHITLEKTLQLRYSKILHLQEIAAVVANRTPHFANGTLVMVYLGDSVGSTTEATRINAGPFEVTTRVSHITYLIHGADMVDVAVHCAKLALYHPTLADLSGHGNLAPTATGAAQARIFARNNLNVNDEDPDIIIDDFDTVAGDDLLH